MDARATHARKRSDGFSLVEVLVAVAIIALLVTILMPALAAAKRITRRTVCVAHQHQLVLAWSAYNAGNSGNLVFGGTSKNGWVDSGREPEACQRGLLYAYVPSLEIFHCGADTQNVIYRTYSMNAVMNGNYLFTASPWKVTRLMQIHRASDAIVFVEEFDSRGWNQDAWSCHAPYRDEWIDVPAAWHEEGATFSFADGHAEYWQWQDPRTIKLSGHYIQQNPSNPDLVRVQDRILPRTTPTN